MSEESISLRLLKTAIVKHSTPKEGSICSNNMLSLSNSLSSLPPLPNKLIQVSLSIEDGLEGFSLQYSKRACEMMTTYNGELSNSSQIMFPRRLSTITGSEESTVTFQQISPLPMMSRKRSSNCSDAQSNEGLVASTKLAKSGQEATIFKESGTKRRKKRNMKKVLVEERIRQWELRQLKNIEEATTHELTIEYI
ncbi:coiled-coil domain-containing protein 201 [Ahaetulla prasina]|uniref:coiled-coil domain-containing protein 201 n=1 Tax=Ahaetulla prasina TaxID=499056 RepID=UPI0026488754|nr:coiled-coil domain-containing protein 201 [Ahaetulla prasina]